MTSSVGLGLRRFKKPNKGTSRAQSDAVPSFKRGCLSAGAQA